METFRRNTVNCSRLQGSNTQWYQNVAATFSILYATFGAAATCYTNMSLVLKFSGNVLKFTQIVPESKVQISNDIKASPSLFPSLISHLEMLLHVTLV